MQGCIFTFFEKNVKIRMEKLPFLSIFLSFLGIFNAKAQINLNINCRLPQALVESSGLYVPSPDSIWSHGDSGNPPDLYLIDSTGQLKRTVKVNGVANIDWEELAADEKGNLYIGDFGNNGNARRDLVIYKINNFRSLRTDTVTPQVIRFSYEDQTVFPPPLSNYVYDAEAMLVFDDTIYIATKDYHAVPYRGITRIYKIPNATGTHVATFVAQVATDGLEKNYGGITGMAMTSDHKQVILISHYRIFLAEGFLGRTFWTVPWKSAIFNPYGNKEAVAFKNKCQLYLTEDAGSGTAGNLYTLDLCGWQHPTTTIKEVTQTLTLCYPNPSVSGQNVMLIFKKSLENTTKLRLFDAIGREIAHFTIEKGEENVFISGEILRGGNLWIAQLDGDVNGVKIIRSMVF